MPTICSASDKASVLDFGVGNANPDDAEEAINIDASIN
jgi:hypothetical protein